MFRFILTALGALALWLVSIGVSFLAVATATSVTYQLSGVCYRLLRNAPTFPVDKFRFAASMACVLSLLIIGVFAVHPIVRTNVFLFSVWLGSLIGSLLYLALVVSLYASL